MADKDENQRAGRAKPAAAGATKGLAGTPGLSPGTSMPRGRPRAVRIAAWILVLVALAVLAGVLLLVF